ncbi:MAG TPA: hypothetical protein ENN05_01665 [Deltaproteobacteria bacterium]|nr:hypothetical protein [Deltaproteobacteria bacterium]
MKIRILHTSAWFLFFVLLAQAVVPLDRQDYYNLDMEKALWVKKKIFGDNKDYHTVFLGTSHSFGAIDPRIILPQQAREGTALNMSIYFGGRNLYYIFARDLLANHRVKNLVLEICSDKPTHDFHPAYRFYCNTRDVFTSPPVSVQFFALYHKKELTIRIADICAALLKPPVIFLRAKFGSPQTHSITFEKTMGYGNQDHDPNMAEKVSHAFSLDPVRVEKAQDERHFFEPSYADWFSHVRKISELAQGQGTRLYILYLPSRNAPIPPDGFIEELSRHGTFIIPELEKIYRHDLWFDEGHLNSKGAYILSHDLREWFRDR